MCIKEIRRITLILGLIGLVVIAIYSVKILSMGFDVTECDKMSPVPVSENPSPAYRTLNFDKKRAISIGKYGFRKKIIVDEPCIITQSIGGPKKSNAYFGIFKDEKLENPIEIVDFQWLYKDASFEEGEADKPLYDEKRDGIIVLQPGTYYAGIYSTSPFADFEASYVSSYCPLNQDAVIKEKEAVNFYCIKEDQVNKLRIIPDQDGIIRIKTDIYNEGILTIFDGKGERIAHCAADASSKQPIKIYLRVNKGEEYSMYISDLLSGKESDDMYLYSVRYHYVR